VRIGSLFTGYGGLDMAVEAAFGARTVWVSDIDPGARKVIAHRFPDVPNLGDITEIDWSQVEPVDIITGGSPCQDLSHAGRRGGMSEGTRSNLWVAMREAIATLRPAYVVWENVRGAYSAPADSDLVQDPRLLASVRRRDGEPVLRALGRVLGDLSGLGYDTQWRGLRAADMGAPHGRFRVFVVARLADTEGNPWRKLHGDRGAAADPASDGWHQGRSESAGLIGRHDAAERGHEDVTLLRTPTSQLAANGGSQHPDKRKAGGHGPTLADEVEHLLPTPTATPYGSNQSPTEGAAVRPSLDGVMRLLPTTTTRDAEGSGGNPHTTGTHGTTLTDATVRGHGLMPTPSAADALGGHERRGGDRGDELLLNGLAKAGHLDRFGGYAPAIARWEQVIGRPAPEPTEPTGRGGAHRLSPRFTEWMMGLPDGWITDLPGITRNEALKLCGNGVVLQQAYAAITDCLNHLATQEAA